MNTLILGLTAIIISPFSAIWNGYAFSILWGWFVAPTFGLPTLTIPVAIGLAMLVHYLTMSNKIEDDSKDTREPAERISTAIAYAIMKPAFALFFGWIVTLFM